MYKDPKGSTVKKKNSKSYIVVLTKEESAEILGKDSPTGFIISLKPTEILRAENSAGVIVFPGGAEDAKDQNSRPSAVYLKGKEILRGRKPGGDANEERVRVNTLLLRKTDGPITDKEALGHLRQALRKKFPNAAGPQTTADS